MKEPEKEANYTDKRRNIRKVLLTSFFVLAPLSIVLIVFGSPIGALLLLLATLTLIGFVFLERKYYNWTFVFLLLIVTALLYRSQRWPLSGVWFALGFAGLALNSLFLSWIFWKRFNHIRFLKYFGFASSLVLSVLTIGILYKNMHWPYADIFLNSGMLAFIPLLFAFVFMLPSSNYVNWKKPERIVFFRAIIIPMAFIYVISVLMFVLPDIYQSMTRLPLVPFDMLP